MIVCNLFCPDETAIILIRRFKCYKHTHNFSLGVLQKILFKVNFGPVYGPAFCEMLTDHGSFSSKWFTAICSQHIPVLWLLCLIFPRPTS